LIIKPQLEKFTNESILFYENIQDDIYGLINPSCGPLRYFMALINASTRWSHLFIINSQSGICKVISLVNQIKCSLLRLSN